MKQLNSIIDFAVRIAKALLESQSSTALFFVQQAYPDDIGSPSEYITSEDILKGIITTGTLLQSDIDSDNSLEKKFGKRLNDGRDFLMTQDPKYLTAEDCLEAFGFSRDGLNEIDSDIIK